MRIGLLALALAAVLSLAAACGDDDDQVEPAIRTESGLSVALAAQAGRSAQDRAAGGEGGTDSGGAAQPGSEYPGAPDTTSAGVAQQTAFEGLTVTGYGMAAADADSALLELYFSTTSVYPRPVEDTGGGSTGSSDTTGQTEPIAAISESDLQPVIDALTAVGVAREDIEYIGGSYYDPYYASATLRVTVRDLGNLGGVVQAATDSAGTLTDIYLQGSYVSYTLSDCGSLEVAALTAAVGDAELRGDALAEALGVTRGSISGATSYAYSPYGGTACSTGYAGPYAIGGVAYAEGQASEVQVYATVTVTYAMQ